MANLSGYYSPDDKPNDSFEALPAGTYTVKITGGEWKDTKAGTGKYLQVEMTVAEGEHSGRKIYDRLNLDNPSQQAVQIAKGQFASLREAVGVLNPKDSAEMMGIRFQVALKRVPRNDRPDEMTNEVQRYIKRGQTPVTPQQNDGAPPYARINSSNPPPDAGPSAFDPRPEVGNSANSVPF